MLGNQHAIEAAEELIQENINLAVAELKSRLANTEQRESRLLAKLAEAEEESLRIDRLTIQDAAVHRALEVARTTHSQILDRLGEAGVASQLERDPIRIIERATMPRQPTEPRPI